MAGMKKFKDKLIRFRYICDRFDNHTVMIAKQEKI